jgi:hypothetical protein
VRTRMSRHSNSVIIKSVRRAFLLTWALLDCRPATEIEVQVTNEPCGDVAVLAGGGDFQATGPVAHTRTCAGTLVVVPSGGKNARVGIEVVSTVDGSDAAGCLAGGNVGACIFARRALSFLPHTGLPLPVALRADCAGVTCGDGLTCVHHACVSNEVAPGCLDLEACSDAGAPDGGALQDAAPDAPADAADPNVVLDGEPGLVAIDVRGGQLAWGAVSPNRVSTRPLGGGPVQVWSPTAGRPPYFLRFDGVSVMFVGNDDPSSFGLDRLVDGTVQNNASALHPNGLALSSAGALYVDVARGKIGLLGAGNAPSEVLATAATDIAWNGSVACRSTAVPGSPGIFWGTGLPTTTGIIDPTGVPDRLAMNASSCIWTNSANKLQQKSVVTASGPQLLADYTPGVVALDATDSAVYWLNALEGAVYKLLLGVAGAAPAVILRVDETGHGSLRHGLSHDATYLYVIAFAAGQVRRVPL